MFQQSVPWQSGNWWSSAVFFSLRFCCMNMEVSSNKDGMSRDATRIYPSFFPIKCNSSLHGQVKCCRGLFPSTNGKSWGGKKKLPSLQEKGLNSVQIKSDLVSCADSPFFKTFFSSTDSCLWCFFFLWSFKLFRFTLDAPRSFGLSQKHWHKGMSENEKNVLNKQYKVTEKRLY